MSRMRYIVFGCLVLIMASVPALHKTSQRAIKALYDHALQGKVVNEQLRQYTRAVQKHLKNNEIQKEQHLEQFFGAIAHGTVECVQFFLDAGCAINACTENKCTPLMIAAFYGNVDVVEFLLNKGASPNEIDAQGNSVLCYAQIIPNAVDNGSFTDAILCAPMLILAITRYTKEDPYEKCVALINSALEKKKALLNDGL